MEESTTDIDERLLGDHVVRTGRIEHFVSQPSLPSCWLLPYIIFGVNLSPSLSICHPVQGLVRSLFLRHPSTMSVPTLWTSSFRNYFSAGSPHSELSITHVLSWSIYWRPSCYSGCYWFSLWIIPVHSSSMLVAAVGRGWTLNSSETR